MANRYWVGGTATADNTAGSKWSATSGGTGGSSAPTAADDVFFDSNSGSGTVTLASTFAARSVNFTGFVGTLSHPAAVTPSIGDATAGAGNIALLFSSGMTYTIGNATTSAWNLVSTSGTQQSITTNGKTLPSINLNGAGSSYVLADAVNGAGNITLNAGTFNTANFAITCASLNLGNATARTITLGSSTITVTAASNAFSLTAITNLTVTANTATIVSTAVFTSSNTMFAVSNMNWNGLSFTANGGGAAAFVTNGATVRNLTFNGSSSQGDQYRFNGNITVTGTFTVAGFAQNNRTMIFANNLGSARTITAAAVSLSNVDFMDITGAGAAAPWTGTSVGDAGGNSGITFTTPTTRYLVGVGAGSNLWSDTSKWATSSGGAGGATMPLPQDNVIADNASFSGTGNAITFNVPRIGKDIDFSAVTSAQIITPQAATTTMFFGSLTLSATITSSGGTGNMVGQGRGTHTITNGGVVWSNNSWSINAPGGSYTVQDDFGGGAATVRTLNINAGAFDANGKNLRWAVYTLAVAITSLQMGSGNWYITRTVAGASWQCSVTPANLNAGTSTIVYENVVTGTQTFTGNGCTYYNIDFTTAGSTGGLTITGANTFNDIRFSDASNARTIIFPASTTTTLTAVHPLTSMFGTSGKLMTVNSSSSGTPATLAFPNGYGGGSDWLSVRDITATTNTWYAGANSTNVSGNTNVTFTASPAAASSNFLMFM